jgi:hypothetical protein
MNCNYCDKELGRYAVEIKKLDGETFYVCHSDRMGCEDWFKLEKLNKDEYKSKLVDLLELEPEADSGASEST